MLLILNTQREPFLVNQASQFQLRWEIGERQLRIIAKKGRFLYPFRLILILSFQNSNCKVFNFKNLKMKLNIIILLFFNKNHSQKINNLKKLIKEQVHYILVTKLQKLKNKKNKPKNYYRQIILTKSLPKCKFCFNN